MSIGSAYIINSVASAADLPDNNSLGSGFQLLWDDNASYQLGDNTTP